MAHGLCALGPLWKASVKMPILSRRRFNEEEGAFVPGALLGKTYRLLKPLSRGGMGVLYLASHERLPGNFVVKVLAPGHQSEEAIDRFRHEAVVMGTIRHPNVVQLMDFNVTNTGLPYLVMEFLPGENLAEIVTRHPLLPIARVASIVRQVAYGLDAAHRVGVVHQDLKPSNIMIVPYEEEKDLVKVIDFGISKKVRRRNPVREVALEGTPPFIAPEQIESGDVGTHSDQFALAVTSYVLLTGRLPWRGTTAISILYSVVNRDPLPFNDTTLQSVEEVLQRGMAKAPEARFASVVAFWQALSRALTTDGLLSDAVCALGLMGQCATKSLVVGTMRPIRTKPLESRPLAVPMIARPMEEEETISIAPSEPWNGRAAMSG